MYLSSWLESHFKNLFSSLCFIYCVLASLVLFFVSALFLSSNSFWVVLARHVSSVFLDEFLFPSFIVSFDLWSTQPCGSQFWFYPHQHVSRSVLNLWPSRVESPLLAVVDFLTILFAEFHQRSYMIDCSQFWNHAVADSFFLRFPVSRGAQETVSKLLTESVKGWLPPYCQVCRHVFPSIRHANSV